MKKNRLIVGGYSCIRAVKSYIDQAVQENDRILINVSLLSRIEKIADDSDEIRQSHKRGQIVTLSYKSSPADIVLDDIINTKTAATLDFSGVAAFLVTN